MRSSCTRATSPSGSTRSRASATSRGARRRLLPSRAARRRSLCRRRCRRAGTCRREEHWDALMPSDTVTRCPYKGTARSGRRRARPTSRGRTPTDPGEPASPGSWPSSTSTRPDRRRGGPAAPRYTPWSLDVARAEPPAALLACRGPATLTVVGSIAFDAVETPSGGSRDRLLGGSAVHFAHRLVAVRRHRGSWAGRRRLRRRRSTRSCTAAASSPTTSSTSRAARRSSGPAATTATSTSATRCRPTSTSSRTSSPSSDASRAADVLFLGNIQPDLQREVREQCDRPRGSSRWTR